MLNLIQLELRQNRMKTFVLATIAIFVSLLGLAYLFAFIPHLPADNELEEMVMGLVKTMFGNYENIIAITCVLSMFCFSVLSSVMHSKFIVSDYTGKRANLLFSYPVDRKRLLLSKVLVVSLFTVVFMVICNAAVFGIFFFLESNFPLVTEGLMNTQMLLNAVKITLLFALLSMSIGLISLWFGFKRKSIPATMVPAYILAAIFSNIFGAGMLIQKSLEQSTMQIILMIVAFLIGVLLSLQVMRNVNRMEAE